GSALSGLRTMLAGIGRYALSHLLKERDVASPRIEADGRRARFRGASKCEWLTPLGKIPVSRRTYRGDGPSALSVVPLAEACGMTGRFMPPDVEEMAATSMAMLTANETALLLSTTLPEGPSATAIQNAIRRLGVEIDEQRVAIEQAVASDAPLSREGDTLVVSWDGVMAPLREG